MLLIKTMKPIGWKDSFEPLVCSRIYLCYAVETIELNYKEVQFLVALLEGDRQTALQLLAAEHFYQPSLLPRLRKIQQTLKKQHRQDQAA
jgi:hypothetical protein